MKQKFYDLRPIKTLLEGETTFNISSPITSEIKIIGVWENIALLDIGVGSEGKALFMAWDDAEPDRREYYLGTAGAEFNPKPEHKIEVRGFTIHLSECESLDVTSSRTHFYMGWQWLVSEYGVFKACEEKVYAHKDGAFESAVHYIASVLGENGEERYAMESQIIRQFEYGGSRFGELNQ